MCKDERDLIIVRHAQAEPIAYSGLDFDRTLTSLGEEHARLMARRVMSYDLKIDRFICSPAIRTKMTALAFSREIGFQENEILYLDELYEGTFQDYLNVLSTLAKNATIIIGHNPAVQDLGNWLCGRHFQDFPPSGMMHLRSSLNQIGNISESDGILLRFEYPEIFKS